MRALDGLQQAARQALFASRTLLALRHADPASRAEAGRALIAVIHQLNKNVPLVPRPPRPAAPTLPPVRERSVAPYVEPPRIPRRPAPRAPPRTAQQEAQLQQEVRGGKELLLEIVKRAVNDWTLYRLHTDLPQRQLADDAYVWLFDEEPGHPNWVTRVLEDRTITGFVTICELLDLDPDRLREHIMQLKPEDVRNAGRPPERRRLPRPEECGSDGG